MGRVWARSRAGPGDQELPIEQGRDSAGLQLSQNTESALKAFPFWQLEPALAPGHSSAARGTALAGAGAASYRHPLHTLLINPLDEASELLIPFPSDHP